MCVSQGRPIYVVIGSTRSWYLAYMATCSRLLLIDLSAMYRSNAVSLQDHPVNVSG